MSFVDMDINMFQMLQDFVSNVERRIVDMEKRLSRVEVELKLLELKVIIELFSADIVVEVLDSVPGLQIIDPKAIESTAKQHDDGPLSNKVTMKDTLEDKKVEDAKVVNSELCTSTSIASVERPHESMDSKASTKQNRCLYIRDDPRYAIYFKMLKMGVPECAVKQKMTSQGIDTAILKTPDALSDLPEDAIDSVEDKGSTSADDDDQNSTSSSDR